MSEVRPRRPFQRASTHERLAALPVAALAAVRRPSVRAGGLGFAAVCVLGFDSGGYAQGSWGWAVLAFTALIALGLLLQDEVHIGRLEWIAVAGLACLAVWMLASGVWGIAGTDAAREAERTLVYLSGLGAFLVLVAAEAIWGLLVGVLGGTVALASYALAERVVHGPGHDPFEGSLLAEPLGYANALGILAAIGLVIACGVIATKPPRRTVGLAVAAAVVLVVALALTSSRGAMLALACGLVTLGALRTTRVRLSSRAWLATGVVVGVVVLVVASPRGGFGDRTPYWRAAIEDAVAHPLAGSGAGSFDEYWSAHPRVDVSVQDAHSLYLESLAELGPLGLLLVLLVLAAPLAAALATRSDPTVAVAAGGYVAFLVHAGIDWDWELPATTLAGLACGAALLIAARPRRPRPARARPAP